MTVIDAQKVDDPANADEVLVFYVLHAEPGDVITLHTEWCRTHLGAWDCTCTPRAIVVGTKA